MKRTRGEVVIISLVVISIVLGLAAHGGKALYKKHQHTKAKEKHSAAIIVNNLNFQKIKVSTNHVWWSAILLPRERIILPSPLRPHINMPITFKVEIEEKDKIVSLQCPSTPFKNTIKFVISQNSATYKCNIETLPLNTEIYTL